MMLWCWPLSHREKVLPIVGFLGFFFIFFSPRTSSVSNRFTAWSCPRGCLSMTAHLLSKPHYEQELHWLSSKQDKSCASSFVEWKHMISWITQGYCN